MSYPFPEFVTVIAVMVADDGDTLPVLPHQQLSGERIQRQHILAFTREGMVYRFYPENQIWGFISKGPGPYKGD